MYGDRQAGREQQASENGTSSGGYQPPSDSERYFEVFCERGMLRTMVDIFCEANDIITGNARGGSSDIDSSDGGGGRLRSTSTTSSSAATGHHGTGDWRDVQVQIFQTMSILLMNINNQASLFYLLSNNHINDLIAAPFDESHEELLGHYISLLKTLSLSFNPATIQFFYRRALTSSASTNDVQRAIHNSGDAAQRQPQDSFPLYTRAVSLFNHVETMVRTAVRSIALNVYHVPDAAVRRFLVSGGPHASYPRHLATHLRRSIMRLSDAVVEWQRDVDRDAYGTASPVQRLNMATFAHAVEQQQQQQHDNAEQSSTRDAVAGVRVADGTGSMVRPDADGVGVGLASFAALEAKLPSIPTATEAWLQANGGGGGPASAAATVPPERHRSALHNIFSDVLDECFYLQDVMAMGQEELDARRRKQQQRGARGGDGEDGGDAGAVSGMVDHHFVSSGRLPKAGADDGGSMLPLCDTLARHLILCVFSPMLLHSIHTTGLGMTKGGPMQPDASGAAARLQAPDGEAETVIDSGVAVVLLANMCTMFTYQPLARWLAAALVSQHQPADVRSYQRACSTAPELEPAESVSRSVSLRHWPDSDDSAADNSMPTNGQPQQQRIGEPRVPADQDRAEGNNLSYQESSVASTSNDDGTDNLSHSTTTSDAARCSPRDIIVNLVLSRDQRLSMSAMLLLRCMRKLLWAAPIQVAVAGLSARSDRRRHKASIWPDLASTHVHTASDRCGEHDAAEPRSRASTSDIGHGSGDIGQPTPIARRQQQQQQQHGSAASSSGTASMSSNLRQLDPATFARAEASSNEVVSVLLALLCSDPPLAIPGSHAALAVCLLVDLLFVPPRPGEARVGVAPALAVEHIVLLKRTIDVVGADIAHTIAVAGLGGGSASELALDRLISAAEGVADGEARRSILLARLAAAAEAELGPAPGAQAVLPFASTADRAGAMVHAAATSLPESSFSPESAAFLYPRLGGEPMQLHLRHRTPPRVLSTTAAFASSFAQLCALRSLLGALQGQTCDALVAAAYSDASGAPAVPAMTEEQGDDLHGGAWLLHDATDAARLRLIAPPFDSISTGNTFSLSSLPYFLANHIPMAVDPLASPASLSASLSAAMQQQMHRRVGVVLGQSYLVIAEIVQSRSGGSGGGAAARPSVPAPAAASSLPAKSNTSGSGGATSSSGAIKIRGRALSVSPLHFTRVAVIPGLPNTVLVTVWCRDKMELAELLPMSAVEGPAAASSLTLPTASSRTLPSPTAVSTTWPSSYTSSLALRCYAFTLVMDNADLAAHTVAHVQAARERILTSKKEALKSLQTAAEQ